MQTKKKEYFKKNSLEELIFRIIIFNNISFSSRKVWGYIVENEWGMIDVKFETVRKALRRLSNKKMIMCCGQRWAINRDYITCKIKKKR